MTKVRHLLDAKGHEVWSIDSGTSIYDAIKTMKEKDIGSLLVIDDLKLLGIITERQYARSVVLKGKTLLDTQVWEFMEPPVPAVDPDDTIENCMALMTQHRVRYLTVVRDRRLVGMLSIGDLVKGIIHDQQSTIVHLEHYIHGRAGNCPPAA